MSRTTPLLLLAILATSACQAEPDKASATTEAATSAPAAAAQPQQSADDRLKAGEAFLAANSKEPGVFTTESGLQYKVLKAGNGPKPAATDRVSVTYRGTLLDGTLFDESAEPISFPLNQVIPGWTEAVQKMPVGSSWRLWLHPALAYGPQDSGPIPGNSVLAFDVTLIGIER
jgi:FKBP-type peptidyl-prolyl cis-trans isomerase FkpA